jgi:hypothetical protein
MLIKDPVSGSGIETVLILDQGQSLVCIDLNLYPFLQLVFET